MMLVVFGVIMVYSASAVRALELYGDSYYFLKRSLCFTGLGLVGLFAASACHYHFYRRFIYIFLFASLILLGLVFIPGIGITIGGATRWIKIGMFGFQPSEFAKLVMILFLAYSLEKKSARMRSLAVGIVPHVLVMTAVSGIILLQRDFGAAVIIAMITWMMLFVAGARLRYLGGILATLLPLVILLIAKAPYRRQRILAFLNPWNDQYGSGFQMIQSFVAFNEGGLFGQGLGQGQQKLFYLPDAHTDFIFSVVGEELGLLGVFFIMGLFLFFCYRGFRISLQAPDLFGRYIALGITGLIGIQALLNMGVVMGLLPTKGLVLPFLSYGGSSVVMFLIAVGILLNISSYRRSESAFS